MNKQYLSLGIIALILIVLVSGAYFMFFNQPQYKNITMNGITVEVPESNVTVLQQTEAFSIYNDTKNKVDIFVFDSTNTGLDDLSDAMTFATVRDTFQVGAVSQNSDGYTLIIAVRYSPEQSKLFCDNISRYIKESKSKLFSNFDTNSAGLILYSLNNSSKYK